MLGSEGIETDRMQHGHFKTYCAEENGVIVGFFTLRKEWGIPSLQHFYVVPSHRDGKVSRQMMRAIRRQMGSSSLIVHVVKGKDWLKRLVEGYFRATPYGETSDKYWYLVEVKR